MLLVGHGVSLWRKARASQGWPTVTGKVLDSHVSASTYKGSTVYVPRVIYEYTVGTRPYQSQHRGVGDAVGQSEAAAELVAARYAPGTTVWVFHDPADPGDAVLEHAAPSALPWFLIGVAVVMFALWGWWRSAG